MDYHEIQDSHRGHGGSRPKKESQFPHAMITSEGGDDDVPPAISEEEPIMPQWQSIIKYVLEIIVVLNISLGASRYMTDTLGLSTMYGWFGALGSVVIVMALWRVFGVRSDPATSERPCIVVPGFIKLLIEWAIYAFGILLLRHFYVDSTSTFLRLSWIIYGGLVIFYYIITYQRVRWLLFRQ